MSAQLLSARISIIQRMEWFQPLEQVLDLLQPTRVTAVTSSRETTSECVRPVEIGLAIHQRADVSHNRECQELLS